VRRHRAGARRPDECGSAHQSFWSNRNETVHSIPSEPNVRSKCPCNICGINFSRNSEPNPRRVG
jgi:hypothetical protein